MLENIHETTADSAEALHPPPSLKLPRLVQYWTAHGVAIRPSVPLSHARAGDDKSL
jgi:hypothetical protein